jgi:uncharacterized protein
MEEILASIRRIIADDDATKPPPKAENPMPPPPTPMAPPPRPAPPRPVAATPPPVEPVMPQDDLESMLGDADKGPGNSDADVLDLTEAMAAEMPEPMMAEPAPFPPMPELQSEPAPTPRPLISTSTSAAVDSAFNTLAHTVLVQNARTLEDLVREMLRPLLKSWLDDNLPGMVERLVRAEIERVSRGRN